LLASLVYYGELPFIDGRGLRLVPHAVSPWGSPAARLRGVADGRRPVSADFPMTAEIWLAVLDL